MQAQSTTTTEEADTQPGNYYVSIILDNQVCYALGPFGCHQHALDNVPLVKAYLRSGAVSVDREPWYAYGTCRFEPGTGPEGKLNDRVLVAPHTYLTTTQQQEAI